MRQYIGGRELDMRYPEDRQTYHDYMRYMIRQEGELPEPEYDDDDWPEEMFQLKIWQQVHDLIVKIKRDLGILTIDEEFPEFEKEV